MTTRKARSNKESVDRKSEITVPAIRIRQSKGRVLYQFAIDGKQLPRFAAISRISRDDDRKVKGYQRPEALAHIASIRKYIESASPMIPNSIVIAFKRQLKFVPLPGQKDSEKVASGSLCIPALRSTHEHGDVVGWIVDGQQRSAAIRDARIDEFLIPVTAFVATKESEQREQFILVNSVKPLTKSLIYESLPSTDALLPSGIARRRLAATVLDALNSDVGSPFFKRIQTPTNPEGTIKDNTILRMLDHSILDGVLYRYRDAGSGMGDVTSMCKVLNDYFNAVKSLFPHDREKRPRESRLVHGVGIISMGFLMDEIAGHWPKGKLPNELQFRAEVALIAHECKWSAGKWKLPNIDRRRKVETKVVTYKWVPWNDLQNTTKDIGLLTNHILDLYKKTKSL